MIDHCFILLMLRIVIIKAMYLSIVLTCYDLLRQFEISGLQEDGAEQVLKGGIIAAQDDPQPSDHQLRHVVLMQHLRQSCDKAAVTECATIGDLQYIVARVQLWSEEIVTLGSYNIFSIFSMSLPCHVCNNQCYLGHLKIRDIHGCPF